LRPWLPGWLAALLIIFGLVALFNLLFHLFRYLKDKFFWRVRNRVLGAFIFVGIIPLVLLLGTIFISGRLLVGQLAANYLDTSIRAMEHEISMIGDEISEQIDSSSPAAAAPLVSRMLSAHKGQYPGLAARLVSKTAGGTFEVVWQFDPANVLPGGGAYPAEKWLGPDQRYVGFLLAGRQALLASFRPVARVKNTFLEVSAPLDNNIEDRLQKEKSIYTAFTGTGHTRVGRKSTGFQIEINEKSTEKSAQDAADAQGAETEQAYARVQNRGREDQRRKIFWWSLMRGSNFQTGKDAAVTFALLEVPLATLYQNYLSGAFDQGKILMVLIAILSGLFLLAELISFVIGFTISRRITRSIDDMYRGTLALQKGDLEYQIPVRKKDQLGLLAHSFNQMSASIVRLLEEVSEKKLLEQELEIAREVQATLFPKQLPSPRGLTIFGGCEPARTVSGDYYDFIVEDEARIHIVVGDISGKGISAALLMANLQAAMRSQLLSLRQAGMESMEQRLSDIMAKLNEQIFLNSPSEKYVTLFTGRYDAESRQVCYCNAGHLPPILLNNGRITRLEANGTVMGLFPKVGYQAGSIQLDPGTIMAIFTDGVTEAMNGADEEFGEERLIEALNESRSQLPEGIYEHVTGRVRSWQGAQKQHDDITLIIVKAA
jgi:sigma-B regulation protein RsbU (phosphoserine phosphatase)